MVFTEDVNRMILLIESGLPKPDPDVARAICATLVGTLQLARAVSDKKLSDQLLKAGEKAAIALSQAGRVRSHQFGSTHHYAPAR
jgi:hypothetical protein